MRLEGFRGVDLLVGLVNVLNGEDSQVPVVSEVAQGDASAGLQRELIDRLLSHVEGNGHAEEHAIGKTVLLDDTVAGLESASIRTN